MNQTKATALINEVITNHNLRNKNGKNGRSRKKSSWAALDPIVSSLTLTKAGLMSATNGQFWIRSSLTKAA
jgi:hypothetical protein